MSPRLTPFWFSLLLLAQCLCVPSLFAQSAQAPSFPTKPIRVIVYTKPGGLIDTTARKFADTARRYCDASFVVENKPGAGGIVAMKDVLHSGTDGHTLLACTKSNVAKIAATGDRSLLDSFHWLGMMMSDPECVITRRDIGPSNWRQLVNDAQRKGGEQNWVGPAFGGLDHVTAMKIWERTGVKATWVPFQSGGKAKAELLGGRSVAYVGNPSEIRANPNKLQIAAISARQRLSPFPNAPTFAELGIEGLDQEIMWRGFAVAQGTPARAVNWYEKLFRHVSSDAEWRDFFEKDGITVEFVESAKFTEIIAKDHEDFSIYLGQLGVLTTNGNAPLNRFLGSWYPLAILVGLLASFIWIYGRRESNGVDQHRGELTLPMGLLLVGGLLMLATNFFPKTDPVGAAAIPRLWLVLFLPLCLFLISRAWRSGQRGYCRLRPGDSSSVASSEGPSLEGPSSGQPSSGQPSSGSNGTSEPSSLSRVVPFLLLIAAYVLGLIWLGYYLSTLVFLVVAMLMLGERKLARLFGVPLGWLAFSYSVFARVLLVPLPIGRLMERFF